MNESESEYINSSNNHTHQEEIIISGHQIDVQYAQFDPFSDVVSPNIN